jgi:phytoene dehydrogenase-like protein
MGEVIDTVVIGAGHAGLALSCYLLRDGIEHVVLEGDKLRSDGAQSDGTLLFSNFPTGRCSYPTTPIKGPIQMDTRRRTSSFAS